MCAPKTGVPSPRRLPRSVQRGFGPLPLFLLLCLGAAPVFGEPGLPRGIAVDGMERLEVLLPAGLAVENYRNYGYSLETQGRKALVAVDASPLGSHQPFSLPPEPPAGRSVASSAVRRLARSVTAGSGSRFEAASRILGWVSSNLSYRLDRRLPQDADSVLQRRDAYCTGAARLTVALLSAVEIPAREVAGIVVGGPPEAPQYHRWIEADYGDVGWVFSDPLATHHYVPATYLPLASSFVEGDVEERGEILAHRRGIEPVDLFPGVPAAVRVRRNDGQQVAAALTIAAPVRGGKAFVQGDGVLRTQALAGGRATFLGLAPGRYAVRVRISGGPELQGFIDFVDRERRRLVLPARSVAEQNGRRKETDGRLGRTR